MCYVNQITTSIKPKFIFCTFNWRVQLITHVGFDSIDDNSFSFNLLYFHISKPELKNTRKTWYLLSSPWPWWYIKHKYLFLHAFHVICSDLFTSKNCALNFIFVNGTCLLIWRVETVLLKKRKMKVILYHEIGCLLLIILTMPNYLMLKS